MALNLLHRIRRVPLAVAAAIVVCGLAPGRAAAQTADELYERAQAREESLTADASAEALRSAARAYEVVVLAYPKTGYADNALWQAADLMERAYARSAVLVDRQKALKFLRWLSREYPNSPLVRQANARAAELEQAPAAAPPPDTTTPAAPAATPPASAADAAGAAVRAITRSELPRGDRITIELSQEVPFTHGRVSDPDRVYFDFTSATVAQSVADQLRAISSPLVKGVRVGRPVTGVTRVVLDLEGKPRFSAFPLYSPFRVVVDVESTAIAPLAPSPPPPAPAPTSAPTTPVPAAAVGAPPVSAQPPPGSPPPVSPPPASTPPPPPPPLREKPGPVAAPTAPAVLGRGEYSISRQLGLGVARIVIDAGHGGHDPGAQANGLSEADLTLDIALRLERLLQQQPGVDVVLTRRTDEFIPLEKRTAIANRENADLFLSIHANSARSTSLRGVETYFLNFAMTPDAEAVAARENATSAQTMGTLPVLLNKIALNNKLDESRELAAMMQTSLVRRLAQQNRNLKDLGVKQAPFVVLIGAQMPSVLSEISFVSNKSEAALLKQASYRQHIAQALSDAILKYQSSLKKITTQIR